MSTHNRKSGLFLSRSAVYAPAPRCVSCLSLSLTPPASCRPLTSLALDRPARHSQLTRHFVWNKFQTLVVTPNVSLVDEWIISLMWVQFRIVVYSQKKRYKSCHWGCTFSKGQLLSILVANMYILSICTFKVLICTF